MANVTEDWRGIIIELDNAETGNFLGTLTASGLSQAGLVGALTTLGLSAVAAPIVAAAVLVHIAWEVPAIRSMDQGNGVILTMPWLTPGLLIPATRYPSDLNQNWAAQGDGTFASSGGDRVDYHVDRSVGDPQGVVFRMIDMCPASSTGLT